jgi:RNA polymerase sigma-70 factor (ECF subfamily)
MATATGWGMARATRGTAEATATEEAGPAVATEQPAAVPKRLIDDARRGDQAAFTAIHRVYAPPLRRYLEAVSRDLAAEVESATWESVATSLNRFSGDGIQFRSWLFTIARRRFVDEVRRSARRPLVVVSVTESPAVDPADLDDGPDWAVQVLRMVPTRQAEVVALRVLGGLSVDEVSRLLGITPENVRVLCHRGLNAIRRTLESGEIDTTGLSGENRSAV